MKTGKEREVYIDVLRIISCFFVIYNHTYGFHFYTRPSLSMLQFSVYAALAIACKTVPVFYMIAGALLLPKEESIRATWHRIPKFVIDTAVFSLIYALMLGRQYGKELTYEILHGLLQTPYHHLWYLYTYMPMLITLPVLRRFARSLDKTLALYLLGVAVFFLSILPVIGSWLPNGEFYDGLYPKWITESQIFIYPIAGYIVDRIINIDELSIKHMICLWTADAACFAVSGFYMYQLLLASPGNLDERWVQLFMLFNSITLFLTVKWIFRRLRQIPPAVRTVITSAGECTFGIYLMHMLFLPKMEVLGGKLVDAVGMPQIVGMLIASAATLLLGWGITFIARQIPLLRKLL